MDPLEPAVETTPAPKSPAMTVERSEDRKRATIWAERNGIGFVIYTERRLYRYAWDLALGEDPEKILASGEALIDRGNHPPPEVAARLVLDTAADNVAHAMNAEDQPNHLTETPS